MMTWQHVELMKCFYARTNSQPLNLKLSTGYGYFSIEKNPKFRKNLFKQASKLFATPQEIDDRPHKQ